MPSKPNPPYLFIGGRGRVFALSKTDGQIIWELELKHGLFNTGSSLVTLNEGVDALYAFAYGTAFCIDKAQGAIRWQRPIQALKHHPVSMAVDATLLASAGHNG